MKRIFATATAVFALAGLGAGSAFAWGGGTNVGSQGATVLQTSGAFASAFNLGGGAVVNLNSATSKSKNLAPISQILMQANL